MRRLERELLDRLKDALRGRPEEPVTTTGRDSRWKRPLAEAEPEDDGSLERGERPQPSGARIRRERLEGR